MDVSRISQSPMYPPDEVKATLKKAGNVHCPRAGTVVALRAKLANGCCDIKSRSVELCRLVREPLFPKRGFAGLALTRPEA
jgi:hypothetical protein